MFCSNLFDWWNVWPNTNVEQVHKFLGPEYEPGPVILGLWVGAGHLQAVQRDILPHNTQRLEREREVNGKLSLTAQNQSCRKEERKDGQSNWLR